MANRALVARLEQRDTGRLRVGRGGSELHVCVWDGEVVEASSADDLRHLLRRLLLSGAIDADMVQRCLERHERGSPVFGELLDAAGDEIMEPILRDRFVENLTRFLGSAARPRFSHLPAIFSDNFQTGHHADTLIQSCADAWDDAMSVDLDMLLFRGAAPGRSELHQTVLERIGSGTSLSQLLIQLPAEPFSARALVARMLRARMLDTENTPEAETQQTDDLDTRERAAVSRALGGAPPGFETYVPDDDTPISVSDVLPEEDRSALAEARAEVAATPPGQAPTSLAEAVTLIDDDDDEVQIIEVDPDDLPPALTAEDGDQAGGPPSRAFEADAVNGVGPVDDDAEPPPSLEEDDPPTEEVTLSEAFDDEGDAGDDEGRRDPGEIAAANEGAGDLSSLDAWMSHGVEVEDDMAAFEDYEGGRGDEEAGRFTTEEHNLDRVEVVKDLDDPIEVDPVPSAKFGAPVLSEQDARAKVAVANSVLATISHAFDEAEGKGRGNAVLQLGLEGSPNSYQPLFANLSATESGELPVAALLRNLNHRPQTEHRRLLNQGLLNLIERVLSLAAEELPDEAFDMVLESVAGYRQRLGI
jgi:hypothetical protein